MTPALYKTPTLLWLITVPIMMVMRMMRIKLDLIGKYVSCICLDSHDDLSLEWIGCIHRWPHLSHRGKSEKIIANHCWSHRITANLPNLVTHPLVLEQTIIFVMHGLITINGASKIKCYYQGTLNGWIEKQKGMLCDSCSFSLALFGFILSVMCCPSVTVTSSKWQFTNDKWPLAIFLWQFCNATN